MNAQQQLYAIKTAHSRGTLAASREKKDSTLIDN